MPLPSKKRYFIAGVVIIFLVMLRFIPLGSYMNLGYFNQNRVGIEQFIQQWYIPSILLFIALYGALIVAMLPLTLLLNIVAGYLYGVAPALIYTTIGAVLGSATLFLIARYCRGPEVRERYGSRLATFKDEFKRWGVFYILFLELFPLTPFGVIIIVAALSGMRLVPFLCATTVGVIPGTLLYVLAGSKMSSAASMADVMTWQMGVVLICLAGISLVPMIFARISRSRV